MNLEETAAVLAKAAGFDNRTIGDTNILAWNEVLADLDVRDCLRAIAVHHAESTEYLMPAHVRRIAVRLRSERREHEEREAQRCELESYQATAGPLTDRSQEIQNFVREVRGVLPEGDVEALHPRREFWRREHHAYQRQLNAEPNPDFDSSMPPVGTWQASKREPAGAWWQDETKREASAMEILDAAGRLHRGGRAA